MTVVLDTNVLIVCLTAKSSYHEIYQSLVQHKFQLAVTNEILLEYHEIISIKYSQKTADYFIELMHELPNVKFINVYFQWNIIRADESDNKFVDCAIASACDYLVSDDNHFNILKQTDIPLVNLMSIDDFFLIMKKGK
jgi:uncharacterized protein